MRQLRELLPADGLFKAKWSTGTCIYDPRQVSDEEKKGKKKTEYICLFSVWYYRDHSLSKGLQKAPFFLLSKWNNSCLWTVPVRIAQAQRNAGAKLTPSSG